MTDKKPQTAQKIERLLFVCTGNTCRSPMAEAMCRAKLPDIEVLSAGVNATNGLPASIGAIDAMDARGLNIDHHRSRALSSYLLADADLVLCMSKSHRDIILSALPEMADKVFTLAEYVGEDAEIADPFGGDSAEYNACADQIEALLDKLAAKLTGPSA